MPKNNLFVLCLHHLRVKLRSQYAGGQMYKKEKLLKNYFFFYLSRKKERLSRFQCIVEMRFLNAFSYSCRASDSFFAKTEINLFCSFSTSTTSFCLDRSPTWLQKSDEGSMPRKKWVWAFFSLGFEPCQAYSQIIVNVFLLYFLSWIMIHMYSEMDFTKEKSFSSRSCVGVKVRKGM